MSTYHYRNLTSAVEDKDSPLRIYLNQRFPNTRPLQAHYRQQAGELLVDGGNANSGTMGAAFDFMTRYAVDPTYIPGIATRVFGGKPHMLAAVHEVVHVAQESASSANGTDLLARASWALALCTEVYRVGLMPGSPLVPLIEHDHFTGPALLSLASQDALRQLRELDAVAEERLLSSIRQASRLDVGPTFDCSTLCPADADIICDGLLLEVKTHLGAVDKRSGTRSDSLARNDLYQVVAYALFDRSDAYGISSLGMYSARYGLFISWPLSEALATMAGGPVELQAEREHVWRLLGG